MDIIFSTIFIFIDVFLWKYTEYLKQEIEDNEDDDDPEVQKYVKNLKIVTILEPVLMAIIAIPVIAWGIIPLLELLFGELIASLTQFIRKYGGYIFLASCGVYWLKNYKPKASEDNDDDNDPVKVEYAKQEAGELHEDLGELIFNAVLDTSENVPFKQPRDAASIETGRETPYSVDGIMAVHQYIVDIDKSLNRSSEDFAVRQLQRHVNQRGKRYPQLCRDGLAPVIYDIKNHGDYVLVEVVLYSEKYKKKIEARRKARIARQKMMGDSYDQDY